MKLSVETATREQLLALPTRKWDDESPTYDSLLIFSTGEMHDSGWAIMAIVGCRELEPIEVCAACCDDIDWVINPIPTRLSESTSFGQYRMDCAPASGALHAWTQKGQWKVGPALSSIPITLLQADQSEKP